MNPFTSQFLIRKNLFFAIFFSASLLLSLKSFSQAPPVDTLLNNKTFTIELQEDMGKKNRTYPDELLFKGDKLKSKKMTADSGFKSGKFTAMLKPGGSGDKIEFEAITKNDGGEIITWQGTVIGDAIDGTAEWNKRDETTRMMYNFSGTLKVKKTSGAK